MGIITATATATATPSLRRQQQQHSQPDDANQKRRRLNRGGRARRILTRWAQQNPVLALLLSVFCSLCLFGMLVEHTGFHRLDGGHGSLKHRMRRAKILLQQERLSRGEQEEEGEGEEEEGKLQQQRIDDNTNEQKAGWFDFAKKKKKAKNKRQLKKKGSTSYDSEDETKHSSRYSTSLAHDLLDKLNQDITKNKDGGIRWVAPYLLLPPLAGDLESRQLQQNDDQEMTRGQHRRDAVNARHVDTKSEFFRVSRQTGPGMDWEDEYEQLVKNKGGGDPSNLRPTVDYVTHAYDYPEIKAAEVPDLNQNNKGGEYPEYPPMKSLGQLMKDWPQDQDFPGAHQRPIPEGLYRFNYSNPEELEMARRFRDSELPFKLYDIPEVTEATQKWTDDYVTENFDGGGSLFRGGRKHGRRNTEGNGFMDHFFGKTNNYNQAGNNNNKYTSPPPQAVGTCQESPNNFFAFFQPQLWDVKSMGLPPVRNNDWTFEHWSQHARYADAVALNASKPHFYWQSGVPKEERERPTREWTFISRDLPSLSSPTETFFVFNPESQKGIQCRFGERGVVAATHYDSGRNMIAMVTGAKRYILAPPKECPKLGIVPWKFNAVFRHSLLNFGHINYMDQPTATEREEKELDDGEEGQHHQQGEEEHHHKRTWSGERMSQIEREWLETAASSKAIETVLKAGEVLYIPSHWFHYIVSLQKSAQCNVRSGVHDEGTPAFGGKVDVKTCGRLSPDEVI